MRFLIGARALARGGPARERARRAFFATTLALASLACGARSGLLDDAPLAAPAVDAGPVRVDAGRPRDAGPSPIDVGVPVGRGCQLVASMEPEVVFRERAPDRIDAPQAIAREGVFDVLATGFHDDGSVVPWGTRVSHALDPAGGLSVALGGIRGAQQGGTMSDVLAICFAAGAGLSIASTDEGGPPWRTDLPLAGECHGIVGSAGVWLAARTDGVGAPFVVTLDRAGGFAGERTASASGAPGERDIAISLVRGGAAWVSTPRAGAGGDVGFRFDDGSERVYALRGVTSSFSAPGIGPWPAEIGAAAIVAQTSELGRTLLVIGRDGGERLRVPLPIADFSGEVTPVIVGYADSIVIAALSYGDADPQGGALDVIVVRGDGAIGEHLTRPTRRSPDLTRGGVAMAIDGGRILVHWAEWRETIIPEDRPEHVTLAWPLECLETD